MAKELQFKGFSLPSNVRWNHNGEGSLVIGAHFKTGFFMEGIVKELREQGQNILLTFDSGDQVVIFPTGMVAEVLAPEPEKKK